MRRIVLACLLALFALTATAGRPAITPRALEEVRQGRHAPLILDVRSAEEYAEGHIPGAILVPHDQLENRLAELGSPKWIVVYCRSGRRATAAEAVLNKHGFDVRQLEGSWQAWDAAKLPR